MIEDLKGSQSIKRLEMKDLLGQFNTAHNTFADRSIQSNFFDVVEKCIGHTDINKMVYELFAEEGKVELLKVLKALRIRYAELSSKVIEATRSGEEPQLHPNS